MSVKENEIVLPRPGEHVVFTDLGDRNGVLVDLNTRKYYQLNETANLIWRGLQQRRTLSQIAIELTEHYDVSLDHATSSIEAALHNFEEQKLLDP